MSRILLRLNGHEANCVYASVAAELQSLEADLESGELSPQDVPAVQRSIETCKNVLSKMSSNGSSYNLVE